jgi:hypothetical protein
VTLALAESLARTSDVIELNHINAIQHESLNGVYTCRGMNWYNERSEIGAAHDTMLRDHFDAEIWQDTFCKDPLIAENGGPAKNAGLEFCADGVNPYRRQSYSMWFGALSILNLPPAMRHSVDTMHLCFIVPGPKKPV